MGILDRMRGMVRVGVLAATVLLASGARGTEVHSPLCLHGCPAGSPVTNDVVVRGIYVLSSNDTTKFADWVAYRVTATTIGPTATRRWKADPALAADETLEPADNADANAVLGTDRGHQAPLASFTGTDEWQTTNYLSNITPQKSALNQGPWKGLEDAVRELAGGRAENGVHVMTGPLYERPMPAMPGADEVHLVPSAYWKIVAVDDGSGVRTAGFVFDQDTDRRESHCDREKAASVREIEDRSGLDFFHGLDGAAQDRVETDGSQLRAELGCGVGGQSDSQVGRPGPEAG